jgi:hypothetical protein
MSRAIAIAILCALSATSNAEAAGCAPPKGFVDTPHPAVAPIEQLVTHTEDIDIERPLPEALTAINAISLQSAIHGPSSLPGVAGTYTLTKGVFGPVGSRQLDCLTDGSTLVEQSLVREQTERFYDFRYVVWNYTTEQAKPIVYAVGEFRYTAPAPGRTHIHWTYSFQLNRSRFPGWLGGFGDFLFRVTFLDRQYADLMRGTLSGFKTAAESKRAN